MSATVVVYLLHFTEPIGDPGRLRAGAQHYVGSYANEARLDHHRNGTSGVPIVAAFHAKGIPFEVARTRAGNKQLERRIKKSGQFRKHCPICTHKPWNGAWSEK